VVFASGTQSFTGLTTVSDCDCAPATPNTNMVAVSDPCNCNNPLNVAGANGGIALLHDVLRVTGTNIVSAVLSANDGNLVNSAGAPIGLNTNIPLSNGINIWTKPNVAASLL